MNSTPAIGSSQNDSALRRGKAMSGAPIISGITKLPSPAKTGTRNVKISRVAWTETSPLYVCPSKNCSPGSASSARNSIAISPPRIRKMKVVTVYWTPITLWSVLIRK